MPAVPITSDKQYEEAIAVLDRVGGTYQGVGFEEKYLLVSEAQYKALAEAGVVSPNNTQKEQKRGKRARKNGSP